MTCRFTLFFKVNQLNHAGADCFRSKFHKCILERFKSTNIKIIFFFFKSTSLCSYCAYSSQVAGFEVGTIIKGWISCYKIFFVLGFYVASSFEELFSFNRYHSSSSSASRGQNFLHQALPHHSSVQCPGLPTGMFSRRWCSPCFSLLSTTSRLHWQSRSRRG